MNNYAYLTILSTDNYIYGCLLLIETGKRTNPKYPFYCIVTDNVSDSTKVALKAMGYQLIEESLYIPNSYGDVLNNPPQDLQTGLSTADLNKNGGQYAGSKILAFKQTQFDKILLLDCDMVILKNLDHILETKHHMTAVGEGTTVAQGHARFYSAFILIEPSWEEYNKLIQYIEEHPTFEENGKLVLTSDMYVLNINYEGDKLIDKHLPYYYLLESSRLCGEDVHHYYGRNFEKIYTLHFNSIKPGLESEEVFNKYIGTQGDTGAIIHKYARFLLKIAIHELGVDYGIELPPLK